MAQIPTAMLVAPTFRSPVAVPRHARGAARAAGPRHAWRAGAGVGASGLCGFRRLRRSVRKAEEQVVTPWEVEAGEDGVDYAPQRCFS